MFKLGYVITITVLLLLAAGCNSWGNLTYAGEITNVRTAYKGGDVFYMTTLDNGTIVAIEDTWLRHGLPIKGHYLYTNTDLYIKYYIYEARIDNQ